MEILKTIYLKKALSGNLLHMKPHTLVGSKELV